MGNVVYQGLKIVDNSPVAIKVIKKSKVNKDDLTRELDIWSYASKKSAQVVKLLNTYEDGETVYLVMELMKGGKLFNRIVNVPDYNEKYASSLIKQILTILKELHQGPIMHQSIQPEYILFESNESDVIKLCHFGLAEIATDDSAFIGLPGSTPYIAPEARNEAGHHKPVDVYAAGVIAYIMLCGHPFDLANENLKLEFVGPEWDVISENAKDIISKLVAYNPEDRLTAAEALKHPWFSDESNQGTVNFSGTIIALKKFLQETQ
uniref:Protein kinase domain-containing protein n=1 Tax=Arcella intermedia TaxID=1963864 RepID=A0A6B2LDP1_9EUKA